MTPKAKSRRPGKGPKARKRNPVAKALRLARPKVVPKGTAYSRKRLAKPEDEAADERRD